MNRVTEPQLRGIVQVLQSNPSAYRAFGPYWWYIKKLLRSAYAPKTLALTASLTDDPAVRAVLRSIYPDPQTRLEAALRHYSNSLETGNWLSGLSTLPERDEDGDIEPGDPYQLSDPDMDAANGAI